VESCNEVETHPEQVARNWVKESVRDFAEVHTWTWDKCYERLREIYKKAGVDRAKIKIFEAKTPAVRPVVEPGPMVAHGPETTVAATASGVAARGGAVASARASSIQAQPKVTCSSGQVEFMLSDGRVVCVPASLVPVLEMFVNRGYRVEATKTRIVVYDERDEEVFSSSL